MPEPKHLIFDLDGTLIHSAPDIHAAINTALTSVGRPALGLENVISFIGSGVEVLVTRSLRFTGGVEEELHAKTLAQFLASYNQDPSSRTKPYPGVVACLQEFHVAGHRMAICTNKPSETALQICEALEITRYFDVISGAGSGIPKKPDPMPLENVMESLGGRRNDTIYIGDSAVDQATARNAGIPFVLFSGGYLNSGLSEPEPVLMFDDWSTDWISGIDYQIKSL